MTDLLYGQVFIVFYLYIVDVSVQAVSCPTSRNQPVNITRVTDRIIVTWFKNDNSGPIANAVYNSTTGGCLLPSNNEGYTIYCEKSDNNNYRFTLKVHQPTEGDVYYTNSDPNDKTTIIFQGEDGCGVGFGVGFGAGVGVSVVIAGVIVGVTLVILKIKGRTIALTLTSTKDTGSEPGNMASLSREASGTTTSGEDGPSSPPHCEDLNSGTRDNTAVTYQQLSNDASGVHEPAVTYQQMPNDTSGTSTSGGHEPSHYEGLNSETRENTAPTYQQLSVYQN